MKLKDLKNLLESGTDDAEIKVENGEITIVEPKPVEYKFKVGDKVKRKDGQIYTITGQFAMDREPWYGLTNGGVKASSTEWLLEPAPQDITEIIKTFDDAEEWCSENKPILWKQWHNFCDAEDNDVEAYLKLRIIAAALNEGWEPTFGDVERRWFVVWDNDDMKWGVDSERIFTTTPLQILFKSADLALYAAEQFADIYKVYFGCGKGGKA